MNVVQLVKDGKCRYDWAEVISKHNGYELRIKVFRDAMKFDQVPAITWDFKSLPSTEVLDGVRLPASAHQLQEIADLLNCMLLTPKVIDMIWLQATLKFDSIVNVNGKTVAVTNIHDIHNKIEKAIQSLGGDDGTKLISCEGKYWCLINDLLNYGKLYGDETCCNYGWCAKTASGPGITAGVNCWQRPGFKHNKRHWDPSQTIRLMSRYATLINHQGEESIVDLHDIAQNPDLAPLISHQGVLKYLRQKGVTQLEPIVQPPKIEIKKKPQGLFNTIFNVIKKIGNK